MTRLRCLSILFGLLLGIGGGWGGGLPSDVQAQDRGTPLFGPALAPDTVTAESFDTGRLWSVAHLPTDFFEKRYGIEATDEWRQQVRQGVVRLPECSGALVSPRGLVLTTAQCVRSHVASTSAADSLPADAVHATSEAQGQPLPGMYADRVVAQTDVTAAVRSALEEGSSVDSLNRSQQALQQVQQQRQRQADAGQRVEVVREGDAYTAYTYRRYSDIRLVFLPEHRISHYGGVENGWAYPRHTWNVALLRIYDGGTPLETPRALSLRAQGARPGDSVFALGFPASAHREETAAQAAFRREVTQPARQSVLQAWIDTMQVYVDRSASASERALLEDGRMDLRRAELLEEGLRSDYVQRRLRKKDSTFLVRSGEGTGSRRERRALLDSIEALQAKKRTYADARRAFAWIEHPTYSSATLRRAWLVAEAQSGDAGAPEAVVERLRSVSDQPVAVDAALLTDRLRRAATLLGTDRVRADTSVALAVSQIQDAIEASPLRSSQAAVDAVQTGGLSDDDPVLQRTSALFEAYRAFRSEWDSLRARERRLTERLANRRAATAPWPVAAPQDRTLRIADGWIQGYPRNGTMAPPLATFFGLYADQYAFQSDVAWQLPEAWRGPPSSLSLSTPLMTASSTDLGGGMPGSVLVNASLQVVGIVAGGNAHSVTGEYLFLPDRMRAVSTDVRGLLEGLQVVYGADRLVQEMTGPEDAPSSASDTSE